MTNYINYSDIDSFIIDSNKIGSGKEVDVYRYDLKVIKIFHKDRKSPIKRISYIGLEKLTTLDLNNFNTPIDLIVLDGTIIGYTEKYLEEDEIDFSKIDFTGIKDDIYTLSQNGFCLDDICYNYIFASNGFYFNDMTSYTYINTNEEFLKNRFYKKNMDIINRFFIGLIEFSAFRKGSSNEYTKMYLANMYFLKYCSDTYYGDIYSQNKFHK